MTIAINIDLMKINKEKIKVFTRKDGTIGKGYDLVAFINEGDTDQFGNNGMVVESTAKTEKDAGAKGTILGNLKILNKPAAAPVSEQVPDKEGSDDLPF